MNEEAAAKPTSPRMADYLTLLLSFTAKGMGAPHFARQFMAMWRADLAADWRDHEVGTRTAALSHGEFVFVEQMFFVVEEFDEHADPSDDYIDEAQLRDRVTVTLDQWP